MGNKREPAHDKKNVVEQAITSVGGSPGELANKLSKEIGEEISRQRVNGWRDRGVFPREIIVHVEKVCSIPLAILITAKPTDKEKGNIVTRAIKAVGREANAAQLAAALSKVAPTKVTRQMVNGWAVRNQFPLDMCVWVHLVTKIPVKLLLKRKTGEH